MKNRQRLRLPTLLVLVCLAIIARRFSRLPDDHVAPPAEGIDVRVIRAVDGDTLLVEGNRRVRLLGINTPETKHPERPPEPWGAEASDFMAELVSNNSVRLEFDRERYDDYDRMLAYVYIDGKLGQ